MSHEDRLDHQLDAERGVIGSLLIDESLVREMVSVVDAQDFLNPANRLIFQAARQLFRDGKPVDALTIDVYKRQAQGCLQAASPLFSDFFIFFKEMLDNLGSCLV